jgi:hypothetical protein
MNPVREFKFSCPVCHQHIQCEAASSGQILACPTCFRNIIVPQAPTNNTTKLILRAAQAPAIRKTQAKPTAGRPLTVRKTFGFATAIAALLVVSAAFVVNHVKNLKLAHRQPVAGEATDHDQN